jgi:hypothetical protein
MARKICKKINRTLIITKLKDQILNLIYNIKKIYYLEIFCKLDNPNII